MMWALVCALALAGQAAPGAGPADALEAGIEEYRRGDFDAAETDLRTAANALEKDAPRAARAHLYLGFTLVALGHESEAEAEFERALTLDHTVDASSASPKIRDVFNRVSKRLARSAKDLAPPDIQGVTVFPVAEGTPLEFVVEASDPSGVAAVRVEYRVKGGKTWAALPLTASSPTQFAAVLPPVAALPPGIEYYIEAWDRAGNGPARLGSATAPRFVEVSPAPPPKPPHLYEKWWFWTSIGAAVAAGSVAAITLGREKTVHVTVTSQ